MTIDVAVVMGTRPEAIKCAPVVFALRERRLNVRIVSSGQHADLLTGALGAFGLAPDIDLQTMDSKPDLPKLTARIIERLGEELAQHPPRIVLVQGDTTTALCGALCAFYAQKPCAHIEAGLRSGRMDAPWPEEMNRLATDRLCTRHYAPASAAREALLREGLQDYSILVTGQTGVDAALWMASQQQAPPTVVAGLQDRRLLYVTAHRRENQGGGIASVLRGVCAALDKHTGCVALLAAHPNPAVRQEVQQVSHPRLIVAEPLSYPESIWMLANSAAIISDSGGIQEEAPSFGTQVLVTRDVTERPEGLEAGFIRLVGTDANRIAASLSDVLGDKSLRSRLKALGNPYGDGQASNRIAADVARLLNL